MGNPSFKEEVMRMASPPQIPSLVNQKPRVQELMEQSALVVVVLGQTEGLFWEYEQLSQRRMSVLAMHWCDSENAVTRGTDRFATVGGRTGGRDRQTRAGDRSYWGRA